MSKIVNYFYKIKQLFLEEEHSRSSFIIVLLSMNWLSALASIKDKEVVAFIGFIIVYLVVVLALYTGIKALRKRYEFRSFSLALLYCVLLLIYCFLIIFLSAYYKTIDSFPMAYLTIVVSIAFTLGGFMLCVKKMDDTTV